ncbi:hypothetical protein GCM10010344_53360 [Streptomyces bluensis]|nr:hypothetical protein GCM10010344_53360 [Streptomyces bluensis]
MVAEAAGIVQGGFGAPGGQWVGPITRAQDEGTQVSTEEDDSQAGRTFSCDRRWGSAGCEWYGKLLRWG